MDRIRARECARSTLVAYKIHNNTETYVRAKDKPQDPCPAFVGHSWGSRDFEILTNETSFAVPHEHKTGNGHTALLIPSKHFVLLWRIRHR